jgi:REP element-mobilizing transposase RayT
MHVVMRASQAKAGTPWSMHRHSALVSGLLKKLTSRYGVIVYQFSNNGNHLHLLVRARNRRQFKNFLRIFAGQLAQKITGSVKGKKLAGRFWDLPVFTRIVEWGRAYFRAKKYVIQNQLEAAGIIPRQNRSRARPIKIARTPQRQSS